MGSWDAKPFLSEGIFGPGDFEDIAAWFDSPEGQLSVKASSAVERRLRKADVDAENRKIVWSDGQRLSITETAQRIHARHPKIPTDAIDHAVTNWLTMEFVPKNYSEEQFARFEELTEDWVDEHETAAAQPLRTRENS